MIPNMYVDKTRSHNFSATKKWKEKKSKVTNGNNRKSRRFSAEDAKKLPI